jgi:hypothetical protein
MERGPEQERALAYLRRKGTEADRAALRDHVAGTFEDFEAFLHAVPVELRARRPEPERWSVQEIVDHLVESHRPAVEQLGELIAGRRPQGGAIPASLQSEDPFAKSWEQLVGELEAIHRSFVGLLDRATDADPGSVTAPVVMVVKVTSEAGEKVATAWEEELDWKAYTQAFRAHTVEHRHQILRTLDALGRAPGDPGE